MFSRLMNRSMAVVCTENWIRLDARQRLGNPALDDRVTPTDPPYHSLAFQTEKEARGIPSPTAQRALPAGIEATTTPQYRSLSVRLALSLVPFRPQRDCNSPARDDHPLASRGVPVVLSRRFPGHLAILFGTETLRMAWSSGSGCVPWAF